MFKPCILETKNVLKVDFEPFCGSLTNKHVQIITTNLQISKAFMHECIKTNNH